MSPKPKIVIAGGGPAGASLAARLAGAGHALTLVERERFPRHKLCGEFISPECLAHFRELGVLDEMLDAGGSRIGETRFYAASGRSVGVPSEWFGGAALSLSRSRMDDILLRRARAAGAEVIEGASVVAMETEGGRIRSVKARLGSETLDIAGDLFIDATGRARAVAKLLDRETGHTETPRGRSAYVGFKAHLRRASIEPGRCEIYFFPGGYGGLSPVEDGRANLCFLINAASARKYGGSADAIVEHAVCANVRAREALRDATAEGRWLAVSVDGFGVRDRPASPDLISIGDAAAFIDPFTGSGMLLALESSGLLAECIVETGANGAGLADEYTRRYGNKFRRRFGASSLLRRAAFAPGIASMGIATVFHYRATRRIFAAITRHRAAE